MQQAVPLYASLIKAAEASGKAKIRGLATDIANYTPFDEPYISPSDQSVLSSKFFECAPCQLTPAEARTIECIYRRVDIAAQCQQLHTVAIYVTISPDGANISQTHSFFTVHCKRTSNHYRQSRQECHLIHLVAVTHPAGSDHVVSLPP